MKSNKGVTVVEYILIAALIAVAIIAAMKLVGAAMEANVNKVC